MFCFDRLYEYRYLVFTPTLSCCVMPLTRCFAVIRCAYLQIRSMRFVKEIDLLVVVEGTAILKIYSAGLHKVGQIEPAISVRKLMIDNNQRSKKTTAKKGKAQGGSGAAARAEGSATATKGQEVKPRVHSTQCLGAWNNHLPDNRCAFELSRRCPSVQYGVPLLILLPCMHAMSMIGIISKKRFVT